MRYLDRADAGRLLALEIAAAASWKSERCLVVGVPRGGILVAAPVASLLGAELDLVVARKIGAPVQPELALGAVSARGTPFLNTALIDRMRIPNAYLESEIEAQRREATRREMLYRQGRDAVGLAGRTVVVVDDGVATGATLVAVLRMLRAEAGKVIVAVPVGPSETLDLLKDEADQVICPMVPSCFRAVGQWYEDFHQITDDEVLAALV